MLGLLLLSIGVIIVLYASEKVVQENRKMANRGLIYFKCPICRGITKIHKDDNLVECKHCYHITRRLI